MDRVRQEILTWKEAELESLIGKTVRKEMQKITNILSTMSASKSEIGKKKTYSEAASKEQEAIIIIKLREGEDNFSETTKRDIKNIVDVSKLGVRITKMKKVTKEIVVIGCENEV